MGFDRIYIGAAIGIEDLPKFRKLLKPGGILVGPVEDELLKVVRNHTSGHDSEDGFSQHVVSGVRFAPLIAHPSIETVIPARIWSPTIHSQFPDSFRRSCKELLLCSNAEFKQPIKPQPLQQLNVASMLPKAIWMEIMSYTHRDCKFEASCCFVQHGIADDTCFWKSQQGLKHQNRKWKYFVIS